MTRLSTASFLIAGIASDAACCAPVGAEAAFSHDFHSEKTHRRGVTLEAANSLVAHFANRSLRAR